MFQCCTLFQCYPKHIHTYFYIRYLVNSGDATHFLHLFPENTGPHIHICTFEIVFLIVFVIVILICQLWHELLKPEPSWGPAAHEQYTAYTEHLESCKRLESERRSGFFQNEQLLLQRLAHTFENADAHSRDSRLNTLQP